VDAEICKFGFLHQIIEVRRERETKAAKDAVGMASTDQCRHWLTMGS